MRSLSVFVVLALAGCAADASTDTLGPSTPFENEPAPDAGPSPSDASVATDARATSDVAVDAAKGPHGTVKIMPLGDSITEGWIHIPGAYRIRLWQRLVRDEKKDIDFVGSLKHGPSDLGDRSHEGHTGWRIDQVRANVDKWLDAQAPDVVLLHIGTNDVVQNYQMATAPNRLRDLGARICERRPGVKLVMAAIVPRPGLDARVNAYNAQVPGIVAALAQSGCDVRFVDMNAALTGKDLDESRTHPTRAGYDRMADVWYPVVSTIYGELD